MPENKWFPGKYGKEWWLPFQKHAVGREGRMPFTEESTLCRMDMGSTRRVLDHLLKFSLIRSHRSFICLHRIDRFARANHYPHLFACSLTHSLTPELEGKRFGRGMYTSVSYSLNQ